MSQDRSEEESSTGGQGAAPPPPPPPVVPDSAGAAPDVSGQTPIASGPAAPQTWSPDADVDPPSIEPRTQRTSGRPQNSTRPESVTRPQGASGPGDTGQPDSSTRPASTTRTEEAPRSEREVRAAVGRGEVSEFGDDDAPRRIRLSIARVDVLSTLKLSFLLSVAIGIGIIVASAVIWLMLDGMAVFTKIDDLLQSVAGDEAQIEILQYLEFNKVISFATIIAVIDVIVITLIATLGAVIYNIVSALIGGLNVTLTDE